MDRVAVLLVSAMARRPLSLQIHGGFGRVRRLRTLSADGSSRGPFGVGNGSTHSFPFNAQRVWSDATSPPPQVDGSSAGPFGVGTG